MSLIKATGAQSNETIITDIILWGLINVDRHKQSAPSDHSQTLLNSVSRDS